jgi:23S rRNA (cytidine2498-2'-O)-methyltransferase
MPGDAPSRSTLKLEEALLVLMTELERQAFFAEGMTAVDLGASPGGWSYQLVKRGLTVTAIDNGEMDKQLMATGMVDHLQTDAFKYEPRKPVDWLVCDVVEQPQRIAKLVHKWFEKEWCTRAIVNFKLPMQMRWEMVANLIQTFSGLPICRVRQLYHDRTEVTAFISR